MQDRALDKDSYLKQTNIEGKRQGAVGEAIVHSILTLANSEPDVPDDWFADEPDVSGFEVKTLAKHYKVGGFLVKESQRKKILDSRGLFLVVVPLYEVNTVSVLFTETPNNVIRDTCFDGNMVLEEDKFSTEILIKDEHVLQALMRHKLSTFQPY